MINEKHVTVFCHLQNWESKSNAPSISMNKVYKFSQKSTFSKFDQCYIQKYEHLLYQTNINRFTLKYTFIMYLFNIIDIDIISIYLVKCCMFWLLTKFIGMEVVRDFIAIILELLFAWFCKLLARANAQEDD
jgi:hypothetical protein